MKEEQRKLVVGEQAWLVTGELLYLVEIVAAITIGDDDICPLSSPFTLYKVKAGASSGTYLNEQSQHRSDLFAYPEERELLLEQLRTIRDRFKEYMGRVEDEEFTELGLV